MHKKVYDKCKVCGTEKSAGGADSAPPQGFCKRIGSLAAAALKAEAAVTPKPGLVDRENSGAHRDMDYPLFLASSAALEPYFEQCAETGFAAYAGEDCLQKLRAAGLAAEKAMFSVTGGVNTHKGVVFSMGILCFSIGQLAAESGALDAAALPNLCGLQKSKCLTEPQSLQASQSLSEPQGSQIMQNLRRLQQRCAETAGKLLQGQSLPDTSGVKLLQGQNLPDTNGAKVLLRQSLPDTNGAKVLRETGIGGIRKEALSGFASAFETGYPALGKALAEGLSENAARIRTLLILMTKTDDSNAVHRGGEEGLRFLREQAAELLREADFDAAEEEALKRVRAFDRACTRRNLSPGGSADLLALTIMLHSMFSPGGTGRDTGRQ